MAVEDAIDALAIATDGFLTTLGVPGDNSIGGAPGPCPPGFDVVNLEPELAAEELKPEMLGDKC